MDNNRKIALIYDFDNTLIKGNMQEGKLIEYLGVSKDEFWQFCNDIMQKYNVDAILACMYAPILIAESKGLKYNKDTLIDAGKAIDCFYPGVLDWFDRINRYAMEKGLEVKHYIISAGLQDMVDSCKIAEKFDKIFACRYIFDDEGNPLWPSYVVNYTQKTQYIARIHKNLLDVLYDSNEINKKIDLNNQNIKYSNMIYFGDGETDVPSMRMVKENGGGSICVYDPTRKRIVETVKQLVKDDRVDCAVLADYSEGSELDVWVKYFLDKISKKYKFI